MLEMLEKVLGLGVIPEDWKQRVYSLLMSVIMTVELFYDIPDNLHGEVFVMKVASVIAVVLAFLAKKLRDSKAQ